jgi:outer membrane immunogenic protein
MLKRIAPALIALAVASPAIAADLPSIKAAPVPPPVLLAYDWTGFYLGVDVGGAWVQSTFAPLAPAVATKVNPSSVLGGGFVGYNRQFNRFVLGIEGDIQGLGVNQWDPTGTYRVNQGVLGAINGRLGFAFDRALIYAIGGVGFTNTTYTTGAVARVGGVNFTDNNVGFDIGGGIEYAFLPNWTLRGEYRYYDFGNHYNANAAALLSFHKTESTFRAGVAYKFGSPEPVPVVARY